MAWIVIGGFGALLVLTVALLYNSLVQKRQMVSNGWADIDVQLKRRADLIPQLVTTIKGYAAHERQLFEEITEKRSAALTAGEDLAARGPAESALSRPVARLMAVAEDYPDLKASQNFLELQGELSDTETRIEYARRFYNGAVRELNTAVESVPSNLVASAFGYRPAVFFEIETSDRLLPGVNLGGEA